MGAPAVVITGGHLDKAIDLLSFTSKRGIEQELFKSARLRSNSTHGTGCAFATSVACHLAMGRGLPEAVLLAKAYVSAKAISNAHPLGHGVGPVHHLLTIACTKAKTRNHRRPRTGALISVTSVIPPRLPPFPSRHHRAIAGLVAMPHAGPTKQVGWEENWYG